MINIEIKSKRKPHIVGKLPYTHHYQQQQQVHQSTNVVSMMTEARRRNDIVEKMYKECPYKEGDIVKPYTLAGQKEYGEDIKILKICSNYGQLGKSEEWPKDDQPMIVYAQSQKKGVNFFCTTGYLVPQ